MHSSTQLFKDFSWNLWFSAEGSFIFSQFHFLSFPRWFFFNLPTSRGKHPHIAQRGRTFSSRSRQGLQTAPGVSSPFLIRPDQSLFFSICWEPDYLRAAFHIPTHWGVRSEENKSKPQKTSNAYFLPHQASHHHHKPGHLWWWCQQWGPTNFAHEYGAAEHKLAAWSGARDTTRSVKAEPKPHLLPIHKLLAHHTASSLASIPLWREQPDIWKPSSGRHHPIKCFSTAREEGTDTLPRAQEEKQPAQVTPERLTFQPRPQRWTPKPTALPAIHALRWRDIWKERAYWRKLSHRINSACFPGTLILVEKLREKVFELFDLEWFLSQTKWTEFHLSCSANLELIGIATKIKTSHLKFFLKNVMKWGINYYTEASASQNF